ncbi:unnamed protein product [Acanthoscelides obtectus]|uniref:Uncharacterized protein n=1 Tax=Acanthoscelides obtectus TaxID=200917 RepID=A0A9P0P385_ACAOB|nr:unnamed protein product [Acanthoscelides obtectus]CAK1629116.1 hypothetical protein AOBTE_LOCUS5588 [Acanthoscelides obtectus]
MADLPSIPSSVTNKVKKLKNMTLVELRESLQRENAILKNKKLIDKLRDKGASIEKFRDRIAAEINYREGLEIQDAMSNLDIADCQHVKHICEIEKRTSGTERYKPSSTLCHTKEINPQSKAVKLIEDCRSSQQPSKLIPLEESLCILKQQEERVKEEQTKVRQESLMERLRRDLREEEVISSEASSAATSTMSSRESLVNIDDS